MDKTCHPDGRYGKPNMGKKKAASPQTIIVLGWNNPHEILAWKVANGSLVGEPRQRRRKLQGILGTFMGPDDNRGDHVAVIPPEEQWYPDTLDLWSFLDDPEDCGVNVL